jgi:hypothetical protein
MNDQQPSIEPADEDVAGHMRPDESMFGEDHRGAAKPKRRHLADHADEDDVEGHGSSSSPVTQTGRPPREMDR